MARARTGHWLRRRMRSALFEAFRFQNRSCSWRGEKIDKSLCDRWLLRIFWDCGRIYDERLNLARQWSDQFYPRHRKNFADRSEADFSITFGHRLNRCQPAAHEFKLRRYGCTNAEA